MIYVFVYKNGNRYFRTFKNEESFNEFIKSKDYDDLEFV